MAVAREDGDIEIWATASKHFHPERVIVNRESVRSLVWLRSNGEDRLFSAGLSGNIIEWDLTTSKKKYSTDSYAGPVWTIAADASATHLAAACEDGLRLFDISNGDIQFKKAFNKTGKGRTLSVAWTKEGDTLYTGGIDGHIRQWRLQTPTSTLAMRLAKTASTCHLWKIAVLADGSVVTGDSRGVISVWDPATTTQIYSVKSHDADVLGMVVTVTSDSQIVVVATGPDSNMVCVRRVPVPGPAQYEWALGGKFRHHRRDVFALAISPNNTLASGGLGGDVHSLPLSSLVQSDKHPHLNRYPPLPPRPLVSFSAAKRRFLYRASASVLEVWHAGREVDGSLEAMARSQPGEPGLQLPIADMPVLMAELHIKRGEKLISSALSPNGNMIACSDTLGVKLFRLEDTTTRQGDVALKVHKHEIQNSEPAAWVVWVGDDYVVAGNFNGSLQLIDLLPTPAIVASCSADWTRVSQAWTGSVAASANGKWVAAARPGGSVDVFRIEKTDQIELNFRGSLPSGPTGTGVTALRFHPETSDIIVVRGGAKVELVTFDVEEMAVSTSPWACAQRKVPPPPLHAYTDVAFDPSEANRFFLVSPSVLALGNLQDAAPSFKQIKSFEWVMHASFGDDGDSLFVIERPQEHIDRLLPAPVTHRHTYGKG